MEQRVKLLLRRLLYGRRWPAEGDRWFNDLARHREHIVELEQAAKFDLFLDRPAKPAESPWPGSSVPMWSNVLAVDWTAYAPATSEAKKLVVTPSQVNIERDLAGMSRLELYKTDRERDVVLTPVVPSLVHYTTKDQAIEKVLRAQMVEVQEKGGQSFQLWTLDVLALLTAALMGIILMRVVLS